MSSCGRRCSSQTFAQSRLEQVAALEGVKNVSPVYIEDRLADLRNPADGRNNTIRVLGIDVNDRVFDADGITERIDRLRAPMTVLFDRRSRWFFGALDEGMTTELAERRVAPAGYIFTMGVAVGFVIGVFICYQILYTDIADHLPQLATLRALGYQRSRSDQAGPDAGRAAGHARIRSCAGLTFGPLSTPHRPHWDHDEAHGRARRARFRR